jgi:hypothetical protein
MALALQLTPLMKRAMIIFATLGVTFCLICWAIGLWLLSRGGLAFAGSGDAKPKQVAAAAVPDVFARYMQADFPVADGFDFPIGDPNAKGAYVDKATGKRHRGWYVATAFGEKFKLGIHPGEDWNGRGGGNTDLGQPVHVVASGRVVFAKDVGGLWGKVLIIEHIYYENHQRRMLRSVYAHLNTITVEDGQSVNRRQQVGTIGRDEDGKYKAHLHLELRLDPNLPPTYWPSSHAKDQAWVRRHYLSPSRFIRSHRALMVPQAEQHLLLIHHDSYRMRYLKKGRVQTDFKISFGQAKGRKQRRGDLKTPQGMYFVVDKKKGHFGGDFGAYFGGHWIKINYPNPFDAVYGREQGLITRAQQTAIGTAWQRRKATPGNTRLGGGIGFHGWIEEWDDDGPRHLSWGCIVMHLRDIKTFWPKIPLGTMVVIF